MSNRLLHWIPLWVLLIVTFPLVGESGREEEFSFNGSHPVCALGSIDSKYPFAMYIEEDDGQLKGWYAYESDGKPIGLKGELKENGSATLGEYGEFSSDGEPSYDAEPAAQFVLNPSVNGVIKGTWSNGKKRRTVAITRKVDEAYFGAFSTKDEKGRKTDGSKDNSPDSDLFLVPVGKRFVVVSGGSVSLIGSTCELPWIRAVRSGAKIAYRIKDVDGEERFFEATLLPKGMLRVTGHSQYYCGSRADFYGTYAKRMDDEN